jgi:two-component system chemotaxis response regulator CheY
MKILIAEDQAPAALFLRRTLERMGHQPLVVSDGEAAWNAVREQSIPLVISDWVMPRMDGLELCRRVRARTSAEGCPYTYVILLTSKDSRQDKLDGLRAGADDFLTKPPDPDELAIRLEIAARILKVHEDLDRRNAQLAQLAAVDELTGAKNRRRFGEDLEMLFALATRQRTPLSLVMLDVDHFKPYNDEFGHPAGDEVLRTVVRTIRDGVREQDVVARYGGEEFVVLLPSTSAEAAMILAERLRALIEAIPWPKRPVTASLGVATTGSDILASSALVEAADQALYRSKRAGRNRVSCHLGPLEDVTAEVGTASSLPQD